MWIERSPRRPDFCGHPPCPLCFYWGSDDGIDQSISFYKFTQDLLQKEMPTIEEVKEGIKAAEALHAMTPLVLEPPTQPLDIADTPELNDAMMKQIHREKSAAKRPKRPLTCDEIADKLAEKGKEFKEVEKEKAAELEKVQQQVLASNYPAYQAFLNRVAAEQEAKQRAAQLQQASQYNQQGYTTYSNAGPFLGITGLF